MNDVHTSLDTGARLDSPPACRGQRAWFAQTSEAYYQALVEQLPVVVFTASIDPIPRALYVSPQVQKLLHYTPAEFTANPLFWLERMHPGDRERMLQEFQELCSRHTPVESDCRFVARDGRVLFCRTQGVVVRDEAGNPLCVQGVITDMTEQRRLRAELLASEQKFRAAMNSVIDPVAIYRAVRDEDGDIAEFRVDYKNAAACASLRFRAEELPADKLLPLLPLLLEQGMFEAMCHTVETGEPLVWNESPAGCKMRGEQVDGIFNVRGVKLGEGVAITWQDAGPRRPAHGNTQPAAMLENLPVAAMRCAGVDEPLPLSNRALRELLGVPDEAAGKLTPADVFLSAGDAALVLGRVRAGETKALEVACRGADGSAIRVLLQGRPAADGQRTYIDCTLQPLNSVNQT